MHDTNKFKTAREMAGLTQEEAAEKTYISVTTIKRIERGTQPCNKDQAEAMAAAYGAAWVADPAVPNDYKPLGRAEATIRFLKERNDVSKVIDRALEILADGTVDEEESEEFQIITKEIGDERRAGRDLLYAIR